MKSELLLGCGSNWTKKLHHPESPEWENLTTLDFTDTHKPNVVHDIAKLPLPFDDSTFDEVHAYEVMEHVGQQGDWKFFFDQWSDIWRILKPDGYFFGTSPLWNSPWAWGDPGHTRLITAECLTFLQQPAYAQVGRSPMTDYRFCYKADFDLFHAMPNDAQQLEYGLKAIKPSRVKP
jgi:SAM-dependent methyltransferase